MKRPFTEAEDAFIRAYWERHTVLQIATMMGRHEDSVRERGRILKLKSRSEIRGLRARAPKPSTVKAEVGEPPQIVDKPKSTAWPDGWSIRPPTPDQLRAGRAHVLR